MNTSRKLGTTPSARLGMRILAMSTKSHPCRLHPVPRSHFLLRLRDLRALGGEFHFFFLEKRQYETKQSNILSNAMFDRPENSRAGTRRERTKCRNKVASERVLKFATIHERVCRQGLTNFSRQKLKTKPANTSSASGFCLPESSLPMTKLVPDRTASSPAFCARKLALHGKLDQSSFSGRLYTTTASAVQDFKPQIAGFLRKTLVPSNEQRYSTHAYTRDVETKEATCVLAVSRPEPLQSFGRRLRFSSPKRVHNLSRVPSAGFFPPSCNSEQSGR
jgi:hypothetical protein